MRPVRLEVEGVASFRQRTVVDLADVEVFSLSGAVGAGKSSLLDAMTLALYGAVPRYDNERLIEPIINTAAGEARVRLDFTVGGQTWTAARVIRRTPQGGATTKEASLERHTDSGGTTVIASSAPGVTSAVEELLGLTFAEFCRTVVLPQGAFADFLHAPPKERRDLLVRLLDLGVYRHLAAAARSRSRDLAQQVSVLNGQLEMLTDATGERITAATDRLETIRLVRERVNDEQARLDELTGRARDATARARDAANRRQMLEQLAVPDGTETLAARVRETDEAVTAARAAAEQATEQATAARVAVEQAPDPEPMRRALTLRALLNERSGELDEAEAGLRDAERAATDARNRAQETAAAETDARTRVEQLERDHAAWTLAQDVSAGDDCPVCLRPVDTPAEHPVPPGLDDAHTTLDQATVAARAAADDAAAHDARLAEARATVTERARALQQVGFDQESLAGTLPDELVNEHGLPDVERCQAALDERDQLERTLREATSAQTDAATAARDAEAAAAALADETAAAWRTFDTTRDQLAPLGPPPADRDDLAAAWQTLTSWAERTIPHVTDQEQAASTEAAATTGEHAELLTELTELATSAGVTVEQPEQVRDAVVGAHADADAELRELTRQQEKAAEITSRRGKLVSSQQVADELVRLLDGRNFERWLLARVIGQLADTASRILGDLTGGEYAITVDDQGGFAVVDHAYADQPRSARTLSGGETFLASLALALALAEQVVGASGEIAQLDTLLIDEGLGSLDPSYHDVVATTIEELGATGRTVGLITHVADVAARLPVRFEVTKTVAGSTITRHEIG